MDVDYFESTLAHTTNELAESFLSILEVLPTDLYYNDFTSIFFGLKEITSECQTTMSEDNYAKVRLIDLVMDLIQSFEGFVDLIAPTPNILPLLVVQACTLHKLGEMIRESKPSRQLCIDIEHELQIFALKRQIFVNTGNSPE